MLQGYQTYDTALKIAGNAESSGGGEVEEAAARKMNDLFGAEAFTESQVHEFVQGLVQRPLAYPDLVKQTAVNSKKQFIESQDLQAAVTEAVVDNQEAHNTMADHLFNDGPAISVVITALARGLLGGSDRPVDGRLNL